MRSNIPVESDTVYKNSYPCIDVQEALKCRLAPAKPKINLAVGHNVKMENETVTTVNIIFGFISSIKNLLYNFKIIFVFPDVLSRS